jgi:hypothetical protein
MIVAALHGSVDPPFDGVHHGFPGEVEERSAHCGPSKTTGVAGDSGQAAAGQDSSVCRAIAPPRAARAL